jgi:hypothetical protein
VLEDQGTVVAAVILYVDDLLIIATAGLIGQIKDQMRNSGCMISGVSLSISA